MNKIPTIKLEQIETDAVDDNIVYCWLTKTVSEDGKHIYYYFGSSYQTKEAAEKDSYYPKQKNTALVRFDLSGLKFSKDGHD